MKKFFGTDGFRGIANVDLTADYAYLIGRFLAYRDVKKKRILLGMDTRLSSLMLYHAIVSGILVSGGDAFTLNVTTTPCLAYLTKLHEFDYGVMISASHNRYDDNGIKIFSSDGYKISDNLEDALEVYLHAKIDNIPKASSNLIGRSYDASNLIDDYFKMINEVYKISDFKDEFMLDLANGSMCALINRITNKNLLANTPSGFNINENCGATSLHSLGYFVKQHNVKYGFAFDGDGDRLQGVLHDGTIIDGDTLIYLFANYLIKKNELVNQGVALTIMSNLGLTNHFKKNNVACYVTQVGDKQVNDRMLKEGLILGGEQSGHIILRQYSTTGDGLLTLAFLLRILDEEKEDLKKLISGLTLYPQEIENIPVIDKTVIKKEEFIQYLEDCQKELGDVGRIVVRASGTEKVIRVMVESNNHELTRKYLHQVSAKVKQMI